MWTELSERREHERLGRERLGRGLTTGSHRGQCFATESNFTDYSHFVNFDADFSATSFNNVWSLADSAELSRASRSEAVLWESFFRGIENAATLAGIGIAQACPASLGRTRCILLDACRSAIHVLITIYNFAGDWAHCSQSGRSDFVSPSAPADGASAANAIRGADYGPLRLPGR